MLRRLRLPGKLLVAALPLLVTLGAVSAILVQRTLQEASDSRETARLASTWPPLTRALEGVGAELDGTLAALVAGGDLAPIREGTDDGLDRLEASLAGAGAPAPLTRQLAAARLALTSARAFHDESGTSPATQRLRLPEGYEAVKELLLGMGELLPAEVSDRRLARHLAAVSALGAALEAADEQERVLLDSRPGDRTSQPALDALRDARRDLDEAVTSFLAVADEPWAGRIRAGEGARAVETAEHAVRAFLESPEAGDGPSADEWARLFEQRHQVLQGLQEDLTEEVVSTASRAAEAARVRALAMAGGTGGAMLLAALVTLAVSRSIVRRVRSLTERARHVAQDQLPALVEALRDPSEDLALPPIPPLRDRGADEVGDLARSFAAMQSTLEHVALEQLEVLRKGVADIFVTLARRNRSLIDRQLALLDQLESDEEDPELLGDLYRLDHLATRMRRNSESLLVLAGSDAPRSWRRPLEIDDVVRAAIGEVEDYRRVDVLTLEPLQVAGTAVADLSHLLSELVENATAFSPPDSRVRVAGHFHDGGYLITVGDRGMGMSEARLVELNRVLSSPPVVGLALEPTLGIYVVAMLAKRHGIRVRLVGGAPGVTAHVLVPPPVFHPHRYTQAVGSTSALPSRRRPEPALVPAIGGGGDAGGDGHGHAPPTPPPSRVDGGNGRVAEGEGSGRHRASSAEAPSSGALPRREPGTSYRGDTPGPDELVPGSSEAIGGGRAELETGRSETAGPIPPLPLRRPGESYRGHEGEEASTSRSGLQPEEIRAALTGYQLGRQAARPEPPVAGGDGDE